MNKGPKLTVKAVVWLWPGPHASWHFVALTKAQSKDVRQFARELGNTSAGVKVCATIGSTTWNTSIFWSTKEEHYVVPLKAAVRKKESITVGDTVSVHVELVM